jgi:molybdate transport repressor ModE-like protein
MLKIYITPQWALEGAAGVQELPRLIRLLRAIGESGSISRAASALGLSYRHAWGLIRQSGRDFGAPLLDMSRGRRATLSALGRTLVTADQRIVARLAPLLDSLSSELEAELARLQDKSGERRGAASVPIVRINASHGFAIELLRDFLQRRNVPVDLKYRGSMEALASLAGGSCDIAGFHVPLGRFENAVLEFYARWLDPQRHVLINLATRRQGIMVALGNPKAILSLADLPQPGVRFVNRQFGSGTRIVLDLLLKQERVDSSRIAGYDTGEFTHSAVAACIASGLADAGFGVETAARRFNLDFIPIVSERYFLICPKSALGTPALAQLDDVLSSKHFRAEAANLTGIDVTQAGSTLSIAEAFPGFSSRKSKSTKAKARSAARRSLVR